MLKSEREKTIESVGFYQSNKAFSEEEFKYIKKSIDAQYINVIRKEDIPKEALLEHLKREFKVSHYHEISKYINHSKTLSKFNLYSEEIGLYYLSEVLKPIFIVVLAFVIIGFTSKFQRNENFFKVLFISISIGFFIFLLKEIISKLTINLSINIYFSYLVIFLIPLFIGLYQVIKIENE